MSNSKPFTAETLLGWLDDTPPAAEMEVQGQEIPTTPGDNDGASNEVPGKEEVGVIGTGTEKSVKI